MLSAAQFLLSMFPCPDLNECSSSPCVNGVCLDDANRFRCLCPLTFTGTFCESLIEDACSSDPCRNGGNCIIGDDSSYQCQCVNGWTGTNCQSGWCDINLFSGEFLISHISLNIFNRFVVPCHSSYMCSFHL